MNEVEILEWEDRFAEDFVALSREWLEKYLRMEPIDYIVLYQPSPIYFTATVPTFFSPSLAKKIMPPSFKTAS